MKAYGVIFLHELPLVLFSYTLITKANVEKNISEAFKMSCHLFSIEVVLIS